MEISFAQNVVEKRHVVVVVSVYLSIFCMISLLFLHVFRNTWTCLQVHLDFFSLVSMQYQITALHKANLINFFKSQILFSGSLRYS